MLESTCKTQEGGPPKENTMKIYDINNILITNSTTNTMIIINPKNRKKIKANFIDKLSTDECFEYDKVTNDYHFYQVAEIDGKIYKLYYEQTEDGELDHIDYKRPYYIEEDETLIIENKDFYDERRITYYDINEKELANNEHQNPENAYYKIYEENLYTIKDDYSDNKNVQIEPLKENEKGWYYYIKEDYNGNPTKRYICVDRIEKRNQEGKWVIDISRQAEFNHALSVKELAETTGKSERNVYRLAKKLGRLPTVEELKAVKRGAPKKYQ